MATYNIDAIKNQLDTIRNGGRPTTGKKKKTEDGPKLQFWKPELGDNHIRFLPFQDDQGQPFYQCSYYTSPVLIGSGWRQVAPFQYDEEDPVYDLLNELSKARQPTPVFKFMNNLRPKETYYAPILVRGQEDKGVQVWELSSKRVQEIYEILSSIDYVDEDLFHPESGRDFVVKCTETDREFKGHMIKDIRISERKKPSKLLSSKSAITELVESIPDFEAYFRARLRTTEQYQQMLESALAGSPLDTSSRHDDDYVSVRNEESLDDSEAASKIEDAFAGL